MSLDKDDREEIESLLEQIEDAGWEVRSVESGATTYVGPDGDIDYGDVHTEVTAVKTDDT